MSEPKAEEPNDKAYPAVLRKAEAALIHKRRGAALAREGEGEVADATGIAISGGGIRSATFALGVFQAFAKQQFLRRADYLSTVSGGGYFGSFFCGLFARKGTASSWESVEKTLQRSSELDYLRENGRYLAPAGSDDMWLLLSVVLRNWFAVLLALGSAIALLFLGLDSRPRTRKTR